MKQLKSQRGMSNTLRFLLKGDLFSAERYINSNLTKTSIIIGG